MTNSVIRQVIVLGALAILSLISVQTYWVLRTWDLQEREFTRKVYQALLDAAHELQRTSNPPFTLPVKDLIVQAYSNYYVVNVENPFNAADLEHFLETSFENQGMREDFQYGIYDCSSDQMVAGKLIRYAAQKQVQELPEPLPMHKDAEFNYYFAVRFPNKSANLLSNMWIVVFFTALMLITVAFFIYAMFIILRQKQLSELQRDFINNMTHEFKTPISTINISTDVFLQNETVVANQRLHRYAGIIKEQVLRLNNQVEKVLQLAKIERNNIELNLEELDPAELVRSMSPSLELKVNGSREGQILFNLQSKGAHVRADRLHLTNILHNLVDNGVKYTRGTPRIAVNLVREGQEVLLQVKDYGIGIAKEHQHRVFDKFYRVPTGNVHNVKGFGLGLYYVKKMCEEHGWKLQLESAPGKGTMVSIRMPAV